MLSPLKKDESHYIKIVILAKVSQLKIYIITEFRETYLVKSPLFSNKYNNTNNKMFFWNLTLPSNDTLNFMNIYRFVTMKLKRLRYVVYKILNNIGRCKISVFILN